MAKNIFAILNSDNKLWVDIFKDKYKNWHPWINESIPGSSWFYKSICNSADFLKHNLSIKSVHPSCVDWLRDPCLLNLPINHKPTFIDMDLDLSNFHFFDFFVNDSINATLLNLTFGNNLNLEVPQRFAIDHAVNPLWIWASPTHKTILAASVYDTISSNAMCSNPWDGRNQIWKLCAILRVKFFIWKLIHGKLSTSALLYRLNIGPFSLCPFCGLEEETADHIIWSCSKMAGSWISILHSIGLIANDPTFLSSGP